MADWRLLHPVQIGPCDASQRRAVRLAVGGDSFVLRGPPGCGKTNTLASMAGALVAAGRRVLVVAKMPVALQCFDDKLRRMTSATAAKKASPPASPSSANSLLKKETVVSSSTPAVTCLTTAAFMHRSGARFRPLNDQAIVSEPRIAAWRRRHDMECFWGPSAKLPKSPRRLMDDDNADGNDGDNDDEDGDGAATGTVTEAPAAQPLPHPLSRPRRRS